MLSRGYGVPAATAPFTFACPIKPTLALMPSHGEVSLV